MSTTSDAVTMEKIVALCKRRGFIFQSSEIYGGLASTYDYGHYGVLLKKNVKDEWWRAVMQERDDMVALDAAILMHPRTWEASGHLEGFTDPLVQCLGKCKRRWREDHLREEQPEGELHCPECGGDLSEPRQFNLMFQTHMGPVQDEGSTIYLRPETAQGIFVNFKNVLQFSRKKPPFGIAQVGKAFRNEITPGNFIFRTREFEQMEIEFFVPPDDAIEWHGRWMEDRMNWYTDLGIRSDHLQLRKHGADELSHYSSATSDIEYLFPMGWSELEGIANRGDFDLTQHQKVSGQKLDYVDTATGERYIPHVIEPSAGADRATLAFMVDAYDEEEVEGRERTLLRLHPRLAPVKVAVLPLVNKDGQPEKARAIYEQLRELMSAEFDTGGSIGKRYRRQDEIGTPWGVTVDHQTMEDDTVTLRDRDSLEQVRIAIDELGARAGAAPPSAVEKPEGRLRLAEGLREAVQDQRPALRGAHHLPVAGAGLAVAGKAAVLQLHPGVRAAVGAEAHLDLARLRWVWNRLAVRPDLPREDEPVRRLPGQHTAPVALEALGAALEAAPADPRLDRDRVQAFLRPRVFPRPPSLEALRERHERALGRARHLQRVPECRVVDLGQSHGRGAYAPAGAAPFSCPEDSNDDPGSTRSSGRGSHQFQRPMISIVAGTRISRTSVASSAIATASPSPISLIEGTPVRAKTPNTATMIRAALEIVAALARRPCPTASGCRRSRRSAP